MSDVITLLETVGATGRDPAHEAGGAMTFEPAVRAALAARDPAALVRALGGRAFMACAIMTPEPGELPQPDAEPQPEDQPDVPAYEPDLPGSEAA